MGRTNVLQSNWVYVAFAAVLGCMATFDTQRWLLIGLVLCVFLGFRKGLALGVICFFTLFSFSWYSNTVTPHPTVLEGRMIATVTTSYKVTGDKWTGFVETEKGEKIFVSYEVATEEEVKMIRSKVWTGMEIAIHVTEVPNRLPSHAYEFSFADYLRSKGATGAYQTPEWTELGPSPQWKWRFARFVASHRHTFHQNVVQKVPASLQDEFLSLSIGDRSLTDQDNARLYQQLGLSHLFAISGLHIGLMTGALYSILLHLNVRLRTIHWILLLAVPSYMLMAGAAPSVVRASLMVMIIVAYQRFQSKVHPSDLLSWVFIATLVWSPFYILQPGYQLSFLAVFSLLYSSHFLRGQPFWRGLFATTLICQLAVLPVVLYHFQQISIVSLVVNLLAIPLFTFLLLPISLMYSLLAQLPLTSLPGIHGYAVFRDVIQQLFSWIASWPFAMWTPPSIEGYLPIALGVVLLSFVVAELAVGNGIALFLLTAILWHFIPYSQSELKITFLYVGQGDSTLIEFPYRQQTVLIDSGGVTRFIKEDWQHGKEYEVGKSIVAPYLRAQGISGIDVFILTHADADHTEGAEEILEEFHVRQLVIPVGVKELPEMQEVLQLAASQHIPVRELRESVMVQTKQGYLMIGAVSETYDGNDSSLLTVVEAYSKKVVLPGDLEVEGEKRALQQYGQQLKQADILKLGHHGSKTSSTPIWLDHLTPSLAIGSAGQDNRYGHPHKEVLDALQEREIQYAGTHEWGTIQLSISRKGELKMRRK